MVESSRNPDQCPDAPLGDVSNRIANTRFVTLTAGGGGAPTPTQRGGIYQSQAPTNQFGTGVDAAGNLTYLQPSFSNLSGVIASSQLIAPTTVARGAVFSAAAGANQFQTGIDTTGAPTFAQPSFSNLSGSATAAQLPAFSGDISTSAGFTVTTLATVNSNTGAFGSSTAIPVVTVNGKGLVTAMSTTIVIAPAGTLSGTTLNATVVNSSLQTFAASAAANNVGALGGDLTGTLPNPTLATVNTNTGSFGGASSVPNFTVNGKGLITAAGATAVVAPAGTLSGTTLNATVVNSSLTSVGTIATGTWNGTRVGFAYQVQAPTLTLRGNLTGATADVADSSLSAHIDAAFGNTRGGVLYRGFSGWVSLAPGTSGYTLTSNGAGADPSYQAPGASVSPPRTTVRQTVQGGPQASSAPNFLPATSASLTLTAQNVSTGANALTVAAAQGSNTSGQNDVITQLTSNPSWTTTASATNYLFINASSGATSVQTLAPIYQFGGTLATTNGQFTFDILAGIGYLGNGTTAVATPLVCVGQATTSASAVTATVAYAYNGYYDSGYTGTMPSGAGSALSRSHNLGTPDAQVFLTQKCLTAEVGYTAGQVLTGNAMMNNTTNPYVIDVVLSALTASFVAGATTYFGGNASTGAQINFTPANWAPRFVVRRGWLGA